MDFKELKTHIEYIKNDLDDIKNRLKPVEKHVFFINTLFKISLGVGGAATGMIAIIKMLKG